MSAEDNYQCEGPDSTDGRTVSRREFLKLAGVAGAAVGVGAGLGGLLAACGDNSTTTTAGGVTTTAGGGTTTTGGATTTVSAAAEVGREVKIGFVEPVTGPLAPFGRVSGYCKDRFEEYVADGLVCGDGKNHPITVVRKDTQSDTNRASQVTADLILNDKVDLVCAASTSDTVEPAADQCEAQGMPCISTDDPWELFVFGRGGDPVAGFKWTYHMFWGIEDQPPSFMDMWSQIDTNKVVGGLWSNSATGNGIRPIWTEILAANGYTLVDGGAFPENIEDFSSIISDFKQGGVEIIEGGITNIPDWTNFWKQAVQQGLRDQLKIATIGGALLFPSTVESLGDIAEGLSSEVFWTPRYPFKSSLTGETCQEFADEFEKRTNSQWSQPLIHYIVFEVAADVLKRTANIDDKNAILEALKTTNLDASLVGPIDFTAPVKMGTLHPTPNVVKTPTGGIQWVKGTKWPFDMLIASNKISPSIPVETKLRPLQDFY